MRAFAYLTLVQMYQHTYAGHENAPAVPIVLETTEPDVLSNNPRASVKEVYDLIEKDLVQAHSDLSSYQRLNSTYIDQTVISGLLARMYLLKKIGLMLPNMLKRLVLLMEHLPIRLN